MRTCMPRQETAPGADELSATLGAAEAIWNSIIQAAAAAHPSLETEWRPSKSEFGLMCLLRQKKRTLLYMTPEPKRILIGIVLGERAVEAALASALPDDLKTLFREARPYAEGRGIRFPVTKKREIETVMELLRMKTS